MGQLYIADTVVDLWSKFSSNNICIFCDKRTVQLDMESSVIMNAFVAKCWSAAMTLV